MSKYIIELGEEANMVQAINVTQNGNVYVNAKYVTELKELTSDYINEHYGQLQQDAYDKGYKDGRNVTETQAHNDAYQRGLEDAWEAARKIVEMADPPYWGVFNEYKNDLFGKISASEAIAKLKAYEEKQKAEDEIKVGDVVMIKQFKHPENHLFVVTKVSDESVWGVEGDGSWNHWAINEVIKADKHFDIASILEAMKA